jgi:hypothetical protein
MHFGIRCSLFRNYNLRMLVVFCSCFIVRTAVTVSLMLAIPVCSQERPLVTRVAPPTANGNHSASLNWVAPPQAKNADPKLRYIVYRADGMRGHDGTPQCGTNFKKISQVEAPTTTYADRSVEAGHIYCYKVTASTAKAESSASGPVVAVIPADNPK